MSSDFFYFTCLAIAGLAAFVCPWMCWYVFDAVNRGLTAILASFSGVVGIACTSVFATTAELPWLPLVGLVYFGGILMSTVIYGLAEIMVRPHHL